MFKTLCLFMLCALNVFAIEIDPNDRIYASSKDVLIGENGIFVRTDGNVQQISSLHCDSQGI